MNKLSLMCIATLAISLSTFSCQKDKFPCPQNGGGIKMPINYWFWTKFTGGDIKIKVYDDNGNLVSEGLQTEQTLSHHYSSGSPASCATIDSRNVKFGLQAGAKEYNWYATSGSNSWNGKITTDCDGGGCELIEIK